MSDLDLILQSLEALAEREGDPAPVIYARLFSDHPELETLFLMDTDGGVRGSMLQQCFDCLIDVAEGGIMAPVILGAEAYETWLDPLSSIDEVKSLLAPFPSDQMESYPVSQAVNHYENDNEECIRPISLDDEPDAEAEAAPDQPGLPGL